MGVFSRLATVWRSRGTTTMNDAIRAFLAGEDMAYVNTQSGAAVTQDGSLQVSAVYSCVNLIANMMASFPLFVQKRVADDGKERAFNHPAYPLLKDAPNHLQTSFAWRRLTCAHTLLWGAGISEIEFDRKTFEPIALWPIPPWRVEILKTKDEKDIIYRVKLPDGVGTYDLEAFRVCVFTSLQTDPFKWKSPITVHRETVGMAIALRDFGAKTFGQGTNPSGMITHPGRLNEKSEKTLRESMDKYVGLSQAHRLMLLEDGMKFERIGMPPEDAQYIQTQSWEVSEIARIFNVPLHLLQSHEKATTWGSGLEELNLAFISFTMLPHTVQWEQELNRRVLRGDLEYFMEFKVDAILRGRFKDRMEGYSIGRNGGWLSANDVRRLENLNGIGEQGDVYLIPKNMGDLDKVGDEPPEPDAAPTPDPDPNTGDEE